MKLKSRLVKPANARNPADKFSTSSEEHLVDLKFAVHKFTNREKPDDPKRNMFYPCFSEFGSEIVASIYIIPRLCQKWAGHYKTVVGWHGREFLYRHMVDEFWELDESHMWLREYARAFHHDSENLKRFENTLRDQGIVVGSNTMGKIAMFTQCNENNCLRYWPETAPSSVCAFCGSKDVKLSLYSDIENAKKTAVLPPKPRPVKLEFAKTLVGPRPVGVFARARKCYGRNLPERYYVDLIERLRQMGYTPIWLGEPSTTLPCPVDDVVDFSRMPEAQDLETTLAIVSLCEFTVQYWTASTRLAAMVGTPYLLFESPDQVVGSGQEGYRLRLVTTGKSKVVISHYLNCFNDQEGTLALTEKSIREMELGNWDDVIGMVEDEKIVKEMLKKWRNNSGFRSVAF